LGRREQSLLAVRAEQRWCGDQHLLLVIGDSVTLANVLRVVDLNRRLLDSELAPLIIETVPAWCSILIHYDIDRTSPSRFSREVDEFLAGVAETDTVTLKSRLVTLPVLYGGTAGPDLDFVARANDLSTEEAVHRLSTGTHFVGMISFIPGQANCMWLEPDLVLSTPKYTTPRTHTPEGTVGLGGSSIAIYSVPSPGGFQMVGRMPVPTYSPYPVLPAFEESPILMRAGDRLRLRSVECDEYDDVAQSVREGRYRYDIDESEMTVDLGAKAMSGGSPQGS
jgi:KipI family sensor histidine kinase inhibitor